MRVRHTEARLRAMPSALRTFYYDELWPDVLAAEGAGDAAGLGHLLEVAVRFEQLVAVLDGEPSLAEVTARNRWLMERLVVLSVAELH